MERLIQFFHLATEDCAAAAWPALGILLMLGIIAGLFALRWIYAGGLASGDGTMYLAQGRQRGRPGDCEIPKDTCILDDGK